LRYFISERLVITCGVTDTREREKHSMEIAIGLQSRIRKRVVAVGRRIVTAI